MRKVIFAINITVDGCCEHNKVNGSDEILEHFAHLTGGVDLLAFGRKTYQLMVPYWPDIARNPSGQSKATIDYAQAFDSKELLVFSRSLHEVEGKNTRIVGTDPGEEILRLKQEPGNGILLGGVTLPTQLMQRDVIDEYHIVVHPTVAGEGRRLFDDISLQQRPQLRLLESTTLGSGCVALHYQKR
jgi:dihydrofolate reductase